MSDMDKGAKTCAKTVRETPSSLQRRYDELKVQLVGAQRVLYSAKYAVTEMETEMMDIVREMMEIADGGES